MKTKSYLIIPIVAVLLAILIGGFAGFTVSRNSLKGVSLGYVGIGQVYLKEKSYIKAVAYFNRAIALDPDSLIAHISLADAYFLAEFYELALEEYKATRELSLRGNVSKGESIYIEKRIEDIKTRLKK
jgi:tetratricopeptide (TPR) repeat protein